MSIFAGVANLRLAVRKEDIVFGEVFELADRVGDACREDKMRHDREAVPELENEFLERFGGHSVVQSL